MKLPTVDQFLASGRHIVSYTMGLATAFGITSIQGVDLSVVSDSLNHIFNGIKEIAVGVGPLATIAMGWWAAHTASQAKQATAAANIPGVKVTVAPTAPESVQLAAADPKTGVTFQK